MAIKILIISCLVAVLAFSCSLLNILCAGADSFAILIPLVKCLFQPQLMRTQLLKIKSKSVSLSIKFLYLIPTDALIMNEKLITQIAILLTGLISINSYSQIPVVDDKIIDSVEFSGTRKILNDLTVDKFQKKVFVNGGSKIPYRLLMPKDVHAKKYPLVITFHNSTRIGNDNENQLEPLARIWLRENIYRDFNCFVIAPQFNERSSSYHQENGGVLASTPSDDARQILKLIEEIESKYPVDKSKIYLVGYSMGASTAQNLFNINPKKFAALVSIAGVPDFSNLKKLKDKNIWLIHGKKDIENPYTGSAELYARLGNNKNLVFTTFNNLQHNNITIPYLLSDEIPKWLFKSSSYIK